MSPAKRIAVFFLFVNLLLLNTVVGYLLYIKLTVKPTLQAPPNNIGVFEGGQDSEMIVNNECGDECMAYINQAVSQLTPSQPEEEDVKPTQSVVKKTAKIKRVSYVPVPGSGSVLENDWTDITGTDFYLSKVDYPGYLEAYFEVSFKLFNGNGIAYVRLFDVSNAIAVQGSEVSTSSQTSTFISSGNISLWEGNNLYRVQAKSLTADTTVFESARLKIISEN